MINRAINHYRNQGLISFLRSAPKPILRRVFPTQKLVQTRYDDLKIDSEELRGAYSERLWELDHDVDFYTNINKKVAPLKSNSDIDYNYSPRYSYNNPFVSEVADTVIAGPDAVAFTNDGRILADPVDPIPNFSSKGRLGRATESAIKYSPSSMGLSIIRGTPPKYNNTEKIAAILHSRWNNYYHWTLEHLLKLRGISKYESATGQKVSLIIPRNPKPYMTESLELMGFKDNDYICWDGNPLRVNTLVVPTFPSLRPENIKWMRDEMTESVSNSNEYTDTEWVYVSRQKADMRRVVNYEDLENLLTKYGVRTVFCEELSLKEEIQLFSNVQGVIGPHGAGLSASVWGEDIHLVEIFNGVVKAPYYVLAHILDHDYTAVAGSPVQKENAHRNSNIRLDIDEFESILSKLMCNSG